MVFELPPNGGDTRFGDTYAMKLLREIKEDLRGSGTMLGRVGNQISRLLPMGLRSWTLDALDQLGEVGGGLSSISDRGRVLH